MHRPAGGSGDHGWRAAVGPEATKLRGQLALSSETDGGWVQPNGGLAPEAQGWRAPRPLQPSTQPTAPARTHARQAAQWSRKPSGPRPGQAGAGHGWWCAGAGRLPLAAALPALPGPSAVAAHVQSLVWGEVRSALPRGRPEPKGGLLGAWQQPKLSRVGTG